MPGFQAKGSGSGFRFRVQENSKVQSRKSKVFLRVAIVGIGGIKVKEGDPQDGDPLHAIEPRSRTAVGVGVGASAILSPSSGRQCPMPIGASAFCPRIGFNPSDDDGLSTDEKHKNCATHYPERRRQIKEEIQLPVLVIMYPAIIGPKNPAKFPVVFITPPTAPTARGASSSGIVQ